MSESKSLINHQEKTCAWSRAIVCKLLTHIKYGKIILIDHDDERIFGCDTAGPVVNIRINDHRAYRSIVFGGSIGAAEAYVEELWQSDDLTQLIEIFSRNLTLLDKHERRFSFITNGFSYIRHRLRVNNKRGSRTNIAAHYDLSNAMYQLFLDPAMQYSSAIFPTADADLASAQQNKLAIICQKLDLQPSDHLLEIGTGWGGLAIYVAQKVGCRVTTATISNAQYEYACQQVIEQGLADKVEVCMCDYRDLSGQYNKIVSIEMIEAVGHQYLNEYFAQLNRLLCANGKVLIQATTINDQRYDAYCRSTDFIQQYIFPGGHLPCASKMLACVKAETQFVLENMQDYKQDYAKTLQAWRRRFLAAEEQIKALGFSDDFIRLWDYYFSYCEGGFRGEAIGLGQFVWRKLAD